MNTEPAAKRVNVTVNGTAFAVSAYHAEHLVDTLIGNTFGGSEGWRAVSLSSMREGVRRLELSQRFPDRDHEVVDAARIADAHDELADCIRAACAEMSGPGKVSVVIDGAEYAINSNDVKHLVDTLVGWHPDGARGWDEDAAREGREYLRIKSDLRSPSSNRDADNALGFRESAEKIAGIHRQLAVALSHASTERHPYCDPASCAEARARAVSFKPPARDNVRSIRGR